MGQDSWVALNFNTSYLVRLLPIFDLSHTLNCNSGDVNYNYFFFDSAFEHFFCCSYAWSLNCDFLILLCNFYFPDHASHMFFSSVFYSFFLCKTYCHLRYKHLNFLRKHIGNFRPARYEFLLLRLEQLGQKVSQLPKIQSGSDM